MKKLLFLLLLTITTYGQYEPTTYKGKIYKHTYYTFSYVDAYKQPEWVYEHLLSSNLTDKFKRTDDFKYDPICNSAKPEDYTGSGYDKGHLDPAEDNTFNITAMNECFYMSNMSPQLPEFNRGIWKVLESQVRYWAKKYGDIYVIDGGIFSDGMKAIGKNNVSVPTQFFKVIIKTKPTLSTIGFIFLNKGSEDRLQKFAVPISKIELLTHLKFNISNDIENKIDTINFQFNK